jgi:hypothetical protein
VEELGYLRFREAAPKGSRKSSAGRGVDMLSDQIMTPSLKKKWRSMCEDARATLEVAFDHGVLKPIWVAEHFCYTRIIPPYEVEFHHFRVGYATFIIALIAGLPPIIWDLFLEDGFPLYPN